MWGKIKGVWLLSQEDRKLRDDLITVLQYTEFCNKNADQFFTPPEGRTKGN